jgi:hypothetical protein
MRDREGRYWSAVFVTFDFIVLDWSYSLKENGSLWLFPSWQLLQAVRQKRFDKEITDNTPFLLKKSIAQRGAWPNIWKSHKIKNKKYVETPNSFLFSS